MGRGFMNFLELLSKELLAQILSNIVKKKLVFTGIILSLLAWS